MACGRSAGALGRWGPVRSSSLRTRAAELIHGQTVLCCDFFVPKISDFFLSRKTPSSSPKKDQSFNNPFSGIASGGKMLWNRLESGGKTAFKVVEFSGKQVAKAAETGTKGIIKVKGPQQPTTNKLPPTTKTNQTANQQPATATSN